MEQKKSIGLVLNELRKQKKVSVPELATKIGITRQGIYDTFAKRTSMSMEEMNRWSDAIGVKTQDLIDLTLGKEISKSADNGAFGESILTHIQNLLEDELREKNNEIREKNEQIRALQKALEQAQNLSSALLGKSPEYPDSRVIPMYHAAMLPAGIA
ncbi:helix-turn-helix domain-containing protein [Dyadobacter bucti]|uniref:helix-turn-helix domain-containing protein n=1 Tax=Dyadobacter bucti TaxID=2572203 RepID=UPI003F7310FD